MWFEKLTGFKEENRAQVSANLILAGNTITSKINNKKYTCGTLEIASLKVLKDAVPALANYKDKISITEIVRDVQVLHKDPDNENAVFQAASQFNLLEMVGPEISPERGIGIYENDHTQGPACAIACGAGTIYRNYFVPLENQLGQTTHKQIDCLTEIGIALNNEANALWTMKNGYALANLKGLKSISKYLDNLTPMEYEALKEKLKIGIQWNTEVTLSKNKQLVTQVYCSALPVQYSQVEAPYWESFARLILEATYEATFYVALKNYNSTGNNKLYLTLVGGGAFGNKRSWIFDAIKKAVVKFRKTPLEISIVSYGQADPGVSAFVVNLNKT